MTFGKTWALSVAERAVKSFVQGYIGFFTLTAGLGSTTADVPNASAFDALFTWDNVKAGVVMAVLSTGMSFLSTPFGPDDNSPSLTVSENPPTIANGT